MYIDNKHISNFNGSLLESKRGIKRKSVELKKMNNKYIKSKQEMEGFPYGIKILVKASNKISLEKNISKLSAALSDCQLQEKEFDFIYEVTLVNEDIEEYNYDFLEGKEMAIVNYSLFCIVKREGESIVEFNNNIELILDSTETTPCVLKLTPTQNLIDVKIIGLGEDITIKNLTKDKKIVIDGEKGLILEEGQNKWKDYDSWSFPKLTPGVNEIRINKASINAKLSYKARWI